MRAPMTNHRIRSIACTLSILCIVLLLLVMSRCALRPAHALDAHISDSDIVSLPELPKGA